jgi:FkbM family methyltransferase
MEDFSVCIIAKNEANGLPRLLTSLQGVNDIVLLDTGSTDNTVEIARSFGCNVIVAAPNQFNYPATKKDYLAWKSRYGWEPAFVKGERYFHFADARNYSMSFAKNDMCFCPDGDEEMRWDLAKVREAIQNEDHLIYPFVYQHKPDGSPALQFEQCKFFRRSKFRWAKWVHEVEQVIPGQITKPPKWSPFIEHHHWQNVTTGRGNYLAGLELSVLDNDKDDRNVFYLGREYMWRGLWKQAIRLLEHGLTLQHWNAERAEAHRFIGNCYRALNDNAKAKEHYHLGMIDDSGRRETFFELGNLLDDEGDYSGAIVYFSAAMAIPFRPNGYLNSMEMYGSKIPDRLAFDFTRVGNIAESKKWWLEAIKHDDVDDRILSCFRFYYRYDDPRVSIVVPVVRDEGFKRLVDSIRADDTYKNYEIVGIYGEGTAIEKFNRGVEQANGKFIVFLADDTEVKHGWLIQAYAAWREKFEERGLVILNDGYWDGRMANHFFCSKNIAEELDGKIWHEGYRHVGADNELFQRLKKKELITYAPHARIIHHHPFVATRGTDPAPNDEYYDRIGKYLEQDRKRLYARQRAMGFGPRVAVFCTTHNNGAIIEEFVRENLKYVDEIYISDNMSTDDTMDVAKAAGANVRQSWIDHTPENYNECTTKQQALDFAKGGNCDWFLYLDSDEILEPKAATVLPELINNLQYDAWGMRKLTFWLDREHYRIDSDFRMDITHPYPLKLWRRSIDMRMSNPPRGAHSYPVWMGNPDLPFPPQTGFSDLCVLHYSFPSREEALRKYEYYRRADPNSMMSRAVQHYEHLHPDFPGIRLSTYGHPYPILEHVMGKGDFVFDIGANYGQTTKIFKSLGARVLSMEPNPAEAIRIENDLVLRSACADYNGIIRLRIPNKNVDPTLTLLATVVNERADNDFYGPLFSDNNYVETEAVTLDALIEKYGEPRHIKIDVEGAEVLVLRGLHRPVRSLSFEILRMQPDWNECFDEVARLGDYAYTIVGGEEWEPLVPWGSAEEVKRYFLEHSLPRSYWQVYAKRQD